MKLYMEPIEVALANGRPTALRWRNRWYRVQGVTDQWTYRGRWWTDPPSLEGERRTYYRVLCDRASFEIFCRSGAPGERDADLPRIATRGSSDERGAGHPQSASGASSGKRGAVPPWTLSRALD